MSKSRLWGIGLTAILAIAQAGAANAQDDRDRGEPQGAAPPTPPGVRVMYQGGSIGLSKSIGIESGETGLVEKVIAQGHLYRRVTGHSPETRR